MKMRDKRKKKKKKSFFFFLCSPYLTNKRNLLRFWNLLELDSYIRLSVKKMSCGRWLGSLVKRGGDQRQNKTGNQRKRTERAFTEKE